MKGFADYTLILLSEPEKFQDASSMWREDYALALDNILKYLRQQNTWIRVLATDVLAAHLLTKYDDIEWQATEGPGGMYYLRTNRYVPGKDFVKLPDDILKTLDEKYPIERGMLPEFRHLCTQKRVAMAEKELIHRARAVFCFGKAYRTYPKPDDGRAVISINNQFIPSLKLSGNDAHIGAFLNIPWGNMALTEWGKYSNGQ